jgi:hypothetical protein
MTSRRSRRHVFPSYLEINHDTLHWIDKNIELHNITALHFFYGISFPISILDRPGKHHIQYKAPTLLVTTDVPIPPLRKRTALGSLLIPACTASSHVGGCRVPFLGLQVGEETTARTGAGATSFAEAWDVWGGVCIGGI